MNEEKPVMVAMECLVLGCKKHRSEMYGGGCSEAHGKIAANMVATGGSGIPGDDNIPFPDPDPDPDAIIFDPYKNGFE